MLSLITAAQRFAAGGPGDSSGAFLVYLFWSGAVWIYWALVTPLIFQLGRRIPLSRQSLSYALPAHFGLAILFGLSHLALWAAFGAVFSGSSGGEAVGFRGEFVRLAQFLPYVEVIFYWAILGAGIARDTYGQARARELEAKSLEAQLQQARLRALQMQLHPHFLFNALNTVAMLIRNGEHRQAVRMTAGLGELLRRSLDENTGQEAPLEHELEFIRRYLELEQLRFPDRLRVEIEASAESLSALVPNLILQPLVENAIRHGVAQSSSAGLVRIVARRANEWLELFVQDDGKGLPNDWELAQQQGIGLGNTRTRLAQLYGERAELTLQNASPTGVVARLKMPYRRQSQREQGYGHDQNAHRG
ncbi:MAG: sensor histidine kinase [Blastocatellia bacterium]